MAEVGAVATEAEESYKLSALQTKITTLETKIDQLNDRFANVEMALVSIQEILSAKYKAESQHSSQPQPQIAPLRHSQFTWLLVASLTPVLFMLFQSTMRCA